jgi:hypothetical protein
MYIEDVILALGSRGNYTGLTRIPKPPLVTDGVLALCRQIIQEFALTQKQRNYALRLARTYKRQLASALNLNLDQCLNNPEFRLQCPDKNAERYARISKDGSCIEIFSKYDTELLAILTGFNINNKIPNRNMPKIRWDGSQRLWLLPLREEIVVLCLQQLQNKNIWFSPELQSLMDQAQQIVTNAGEWTPILAYENQQYLYKNCSPSVPSCTACNLQEALIQAKLVGIQHFDNTVHQQLAENPQSMVIKSVMDNYGKMPTTLHGSLALQEILPLIKYLKTWLVVVPYFDELKTVQHMVEQFNGIGVANHEISVLFRLSNKTHSDFNQYVKQSQINNKPGHNSRVIFIRDRIPPSLKTCGIGIDGILCLHEGISSYEVRSYIHQHPCVIQLSIRNKNLELKF